MGRQNSKGDWTNLLPVTLKVHQSDFVLPVLPGCYSSWIPTRGATLRQCAVKLNSCQSQESSENILWCPSISVFWFAQRSLRRSFEQTSFDFHQSLFDLMNNWCCRSKVTVKGWSLWITTNNPNSWHARWTMNWPRRTCKPDSSISFLFFFVI